MRTPERYIDRVTNGQPTESGAEELDPERRREEAFVLALRTREGADASDRARSAITELAELRLLEAAGERVVLTQRGRLLANEVTVRLLAAGASDAKASASEPTQAAPAASPTGAARTDAAGTR